MEKRLKLLLIASVFSPLLALSQTNKNYISIGYSSICCGTPSEKPIMDYVKDFEKSKKLKPFEIFVEYGLGKEGEHIFYIGTDNLNTELLNLFFEGLKITATNQNKLRSKNRNGYINVDNKLTSNLTLKNIKDRPKSSISSLEIYDYKK